MQWTTKHHFMQNKRNLRAQFEKAVLKEQRFFWVTDRFPDSVCQSSHPPQQAKPWHKILHKIQRGKRKKSQEESRAVETLGSNMDIWTNCSGNLATQASDWFASLVGSESWRQRLPNNTHWSWISESVEFYLTQRQEKSPKKCARFVQSLLQCLKETRTKGLSQLTWHALQDVLSGKKIGNGQRQRGKLKTSMWTSGRPEDIIPGSRTTIERNKTGYFGKRHIYVTHCHGNLFQLFLCPVVFSKCQII